MTQRLWHESEILTALAAGASVVAASERLARVVRLAYAHAQTADGARVWERPAVWSWNGFLHDLCAQLGNAALASPRTALPMLLSVAQAETLWERVIHDSNAAAGLLQPSATAHEAAAAWELCCAFHISADDCDGAAAGDDSREFAAWIREFLRRCGQRGWLEEARLPEYLASRMDNIARALPPQLLFTGFEEFTPQQETLLTRLSESGTEVRRLSMDEGEASKGRRVQCADAETEMRTAAAWARGILERESGARVAIVVQDLASARNQLAHILDDSLCPRALLGESAPRPYSLSLGWPLADCALMHDGLALLEVAQRRLTFATASLLLRSPFFAAADSEQAARARLEVRLRGHRANSVSLPRLAALARQHGAPRLATALEACLTLLTEIPATQTASGWARSFSGMLASLGWPGERTPDSDEFQVLEKYREVLGEFARLDAVLGNISCSAAMTRVRRLAAQSTFQALSADVPVQVLGMPETAGLKFDYLWVQGLSDDNWPASPRPNPLLPWNLQRRLQLPHASAQRELDYAQRQTQRLLASAAQVIVSSAERTAETPLRPSPLIAGLPSVEIETLIPDGVPSYGELLQAQNQTALSHFTDTQGPPLGAQEQVRGGTGVLKSQAACPFQAFAQYRLGAAPMSIPGPGLDAMTRGALVHKALEQLWGKLGDQAQLAKLDDAARTDWVQDCVARIIHAEAGHHPEVFTPKFRELETARLSQLLLEWLAVEMQRAPFAVAERESTHAAHFDPLQLVTRVDRIDRLVDGSRVIIDYKTGQADPNDWLGERPDEPQLPVYAISNPEHLAGVLFARLRAGDCAYAGFTLHDGIAPGVPAYTQPKRQPDAPADWSGLLGHWQNVINTLANDFSRGEAQLDPKRGPDTCARCHLSVLCRIHERDDAMMMETGGDE